jgi:hypothetical protein
MGNKPFSFIFFLLGLIDCGGFERHFIVTVGKVMVFVQKAFHMPNQAEDICFSISCEQNFIMQKYS